MPPFGDLASCAQAMISVHRERVLEVQLFIFRWSKSSREDPHWALGHPKARDPPPSGERLWLLLPRVTQLQSWYEMLEPQWLVQLPIKILGLYPGAILVSSRSLQHL